MLKSHENTYSGGSAAILNKQVLHQVNNQKQKAMNQVIETITTRRAVRRYKELAVEKSVIDQVIEAGRWAPSAMNEQSWRFYVLTDSEKIHRLAGDIAHLAFRLKDRTLGELKAAALSIFHFSGLKELLTQDDHIFYHAPVVVFITAPDDNEWTGLNTGMCAQNMMLAAKSLGLDSCPIGLARFVEKTAHYPDLQIPVGEHIELALVLGYGAQQPKPHPRITNNVTYL
ncbi:MAG: nitroreductase family protein [Mucilaginibacter sp.]